MLRQIIVLLVIVASSLLSSCGLMGYERWAAYRVDVEVRALSGEPLPDAAISTTNGQELRSNKDGKAQLRYMTSGLHVITVSSPGWQTRQIKVVVPLAKPEVVTILLEKERVRRPTNGSISVSLNSGY